MSTVFGDNGLVVPAVVFFSAVFGLILVGGHCEARWRLYSALNNRFRKPKLRPPESFHAEGDPGLVLWLKRQSPFLGRPDLNSKKAFQSWQKSLRASLLDLFDVPAISSPIEVRTRRIRSTVERYDLAQRERRSRLSDSKEWLCRLDLSHIFKNS